MLEALIFDVDGTVAETEDLHRRAFNLAFREGGVELWWDAREYRRLLRFHGGKERIERALAEHETPLPTAAVAEIHAAKCRFYAMLLSAEGASWRPRVRAAHAVAFEDSAAGVEAATRAGLAVIATPSRWLAGDDLAGADLVVDHLGDAGRLWERRHPLLRKRWLSVKGLADWHGRRETPCTRRA